ncbi:MAG: hypothetical protein KDE15_08305 [Erythrobacter sp.]|nr:hypothetical protein [Erythrobacter sp.]
MKPFRLALLLAVPALAAGQPAMAQDEPTLEQRFDDPPAEALPRLRWWWPGADVTEDELDRELALLAEAGFGGAEIQAFTPNFVTLTPEQAARVNDYAEPRFFDLVRHAGETAQRHGLTLDYTFGSSWPSGGGMAITPEHALVELTMARTEIAGGATGPVQVQIPARTRRMGALGMFDARNRDPAVADWAARFDARARTVAVIAVRGTAPQMADTSAAAPLAVPIQLSAWSDVARPGELDMASAVNLTDRLSEDGTLDWTPPAGTWQVFVFRQYASNMGVMGAAGQGPQLVLDHFDRNAFAAHAARVGYPLGVAPAGLRATFVDSLELMQDLPWSEQFLARFAELRGYQLTPYLPLLVQPGWMQAWNEHYSPPYFDATGSDLAERVREDYRQTVSDLLLSEFLQPLADWNHAHGLQLKFQAHGGALDQIRAYGLSDIPETEDLVHNGDPYFMRLARSAAHLYGRPLVSAESLVWKDRPFDVTPDEMRQRLDLLFAGGVNAVNLHGFDYSYAEEQWPGWHAFLPSAFSGGFSTMLAETNPVWPAVPQLAAYAARTQALLQAGEAVVPVAYFYGRTGYYLGMEDDGAGDQAAERGLLEAGYDYDRINPDSLLAASVRDGRLIAQGGQDYAALALPPLDGISPEVAMRIADFAEAGLPVLFIGRAPQRAMGLADATARDAQVRAAIARAMAAGAQVVPEAALPGALAAAQVQRNIALPYADAAGLVFVQRREGDRIISFLHNPGEQALAFPIGLPGVGEVTRWDAMNDAILPVSAQAVQGWTMVDLDLAPGASAMFVLDPATAPQYRALPVVLDRREMPAEGWQLTVDGHAGREALAAEFPAVSLGDWRESDALSHFAGTGTYRGSIDLEAGWARHNGRVMLDLGEVHDMAQVTVNDIAFAPLVSAPFRVDVTSAVRAGSNTIAIAVSNVPQNALLSDAPGYRRLEAVPAGLAGPVRVELLAGE